jgi:4-hydroxythreonine-4-phosphate dehydrogenase
MTATPSTDGPPPGRPLAVSVGDPAGVGPLVAVRAAAERSSSVPMALFGDADRLSDGLAAAGIGRERIQRVTALESLELAPGSLGLVHIGRWEEGTVLAREPTARGGEAQLAALEAAARWAADGRARALVTGPTSKAAVNRSGTSFTGQTEHLAALAGLGRDAVTMLFIGPRLAVALVTTHLPLRLVPEEITAARVARTARHLVEALGRLRPAPFRVAVAGLNPHAGEGGLLGMEEQTVVAEGMRLAELASGAELHGPVPAETALRRAAEGSYEGVVAMFHDQATIASKLLDWGRAVNVTWGLPFVRTSVDHGVAYDAAASGTADATGMIAAVDLASRLTSQSQATGPS